jgi:hypothetical protein
MRDYRSSIEIMLLIMAMALLVACLGGSDGGLGPEGADETPPTIAQVNPAAGAAEIEVGATIVVDFSEAIAEASVGAATVQLAPDAEPTLLATGSAAVNGAQLSFTPSAPLSHGTLYRVEIDGSVSDLSENPMGEAYSWTFTTAEPPTAPLQFPLATGNAWLYDGESSATVWSAYGVSTSSFEGWYLLYLEREESYGARGGWLARKFTLDQTLTAESALETDFFYLSGDAEGLYLADPDGSWGNILRFDGLQFDDSAFLLADGPAHSDGSTLSVSSAQVPAGFYETLLVEHDYSSTGPYADADIFETRREHYADGVGLAAASWSYSYDDNDPSGIDITTQGSALLREAVGSAALPHLSGELEPNDGPGATSAQVFAPFAIVSGSVHITDTGIVLSDADVDCQDAECIIPDSEGVRRLEDWYRVDVAVAGQYRLDLVFEEYNSDNSTWNDLDLYVFYDLGGGEVAYAIRATDEPGEPEWVVFTWLPAGSYYFAVQAWDTPAGPVPYTIAMREQAVEVLAPRSSGGSIPFGAEASTGK